MCGRWSQLCDCLLSCDWVQVYLSYQSRHRELIMLYSISVWLHTGALRVYPVHNTPVRQLGLPTFCDRKDLFCINDVCIGHFPLTFGGFSRKAQNTSLQKTPLIYTYKTFKAVCAPFSSNTVPATKRCRRGWKPLFEPRPQALNMPRDPFCHNTHNPLKEHTCNHSHIHICRARHWRVISTLKENYFHFDLERMGRVHDDEWMNEEIVLPLCTPGLQWNPHKFFGLLLAAFLGALSSYTPHTQSKIQCSHRWIRLLEIP